MPRRPSSRARRRAGGRTAPALRGQRRRPADLTEVDAGDPPALVGTDRDQRDAEFAVGRAALVLGVLDLATDRHRGVVVDDRRGFLEAQLVGDQMAVAIPVEPLLLVQDEADGPDEAEA